ncbi:MAG TPA: Crp/Fnr family transcriptional regulator [Hyphomicrobiaceae bacterium]|nr:Crp/Fnr family transcriptional regulator [Hyphomicrobiaceae bacterium]
MGSDVPRVRRRNHLLASLPPSDRALLEPHLEPVALRIRQRLEWPNRTVPKAYFLEHGLASVMTISMGERVKVEVAMIGPEGMTGVGLLLGVDRWRAETCMLIEGEGYSIAAEVLRKAMHQCPALRSSLLRYVHCFAVQLAQTALANARGSVEQRLARWLLMAHDRIEGDVLTITHEGLAVILGVRRAGVTTALHQFEARALVATSRGKVTILDRSGLRERAGGLYGAAEAQYDRLFPGRAGCEPERDAGRRSC